MSCTEIIAFKKDGSPTYYQDVDNAWRGAMKIWNVLNKKYLGGATHVMIDPRPVFDLYKDKSVSREDKIILGSTFDRAILSKELLEEVIISYRNFAKENEGSSLDEQADILQEILEDDKYIGVAFNQTSVVENQWIKNVYNDETEEEEMIGYNMLTEEKHFLVVEDVNTMEVICNIAKSRRFEN